MSIKGKHMDFIIDDVFSKRLRKLTADELSGLEKLLVGNGCLNPLIVWDEENILLDGHHRHEICSRCNIPYEIRRISLPSREEALLWVLRHQRDRRNCTDGEKYAFTREIRELLKEQGRRKQLQTLKQNENTVLSNIDKTVEHNTQQDIASELGWSTGKVAQADYAWEHGDDNIKRKLIGGEYSVNQAYRLARKKEKKRERNEAVAAVKLPNTGDHFHLITRDVAKVDQEVADDSLDWIITDPPYPREYLPVYDALARFAAAKLKPGGSLVCMVGQSYLPEILSRLCAAGLNYHWTLAYLTPGGQAVQLWQRNVNTFWKPLLWLTKGEYTGNWIGDVCRSKPNDNDKRFHDWGQSESGMADILERFTKPNDLICDPFCGGGATGVAAVRLGRRFLGIDIEQSCIDSTASRLNTILAEVG